MRMLQPEGDMGEEELAAASAQMALAMMMGGQGEGGVGPQGGGTGAGTPGKPEEPVAPMPPPSGMPTQTGELTSQEEGGPPAGQGIAAALSKLSSAAPKLGGEI